MTRAGLVGLFCLAWAGMAGADPAERAMAAAHALEAATQAMQAAQSGRDQIAALTQTIQSYEDGMIALRDGLRNAQVQEAALAQQFAARGQDLARLLSVLMATERLDTSLGYLHPDGALEAARAGMLLSDVTPRWRAMWRNCAMRWKICAPCAARGNSDYWRWNKGWSRHKRRGLPWRRQFRIVAPCRKT
jgi:hypothetical protein